MTHRTGVPAASGGSGSLEFGDGAPGKGRHSTESLRESNPFVPIGLAGRAALILFVLVYRVLTPGLQEVVSPSGTPLVGARLTADWIHALLALAPVLFYRRDWGWLHPLVFPVAWSIISTLGRSPDALLAPLAVFSGPREIELSYAALQGWSQEAIARAELKATLLQIIAISCYYLAFFLGPRLPIPRFHPRGPRHVTLKMLLVVLMAAATVVLFIEARGGIVQHILSLGRGRGRTLEGTGPIQVLAQTGVVAMLLWFSLRRRATRNPLFWGGMTFALFSGFIMSGSRSSIAYTGAMFLIVWMLRHRRLPAVRGIAAAFIFFLLVGVLGELRSSGLRGETLEISALVEPDLARLVDLSREAVTSRNLGFVTVVARAPEVGFLGGKTYLNVILFWVPRAIWEGKPRGAGGYAGEMLFGRGEGGGGVPTGPVGEAYWNFDLPGVVLIFFLYGAFHRWLVAMLVAYRNQPAAWPLYTIVLMNINPHMIEFLSGLQMLVPALLFLVWLRVFRPPLITHLGMQRR